MGRRIIRTSSQDLKKLLLNPTGGRFLRPLDAFDQVYPGILLGDASTALSTCLLKELKVTHVLNAAHGKNDDYYGGFVNTSFSNYDQAGIKFMGVPALDSPSFYLRSYFKQAADFIEEALKSGGKVLIHCQCGISRSATLIAAYLMLKKGMDCQEALSTIRSHRSIFPNQGFLSQLSDLDYELKRTGDSQQNSKSRKSVEKEEKKPLLDPVYSPAFHSDNRPMFSHSNYTPWTRPLTCGGYRLTDSTYDIATKSRSRARSEERAARSLYDFTRSRSASPPPSSFRDYRATSAMPDSSYYESRIVSAVPRTKFIEARTAPVLTSYESLSNPYQRNYYHTRTAPETFTYSPRISARPYTDSYLKLRYAPTEDLGYTRTYSPRTSSYISSISPYESYTLSSAFGNRSYSTYTPTSMPNRRFSTSSSLSSSLRYPAQYPATFRHSFGVGLKAY